MVVAGISHSTLAERIKASVRRNRAEYRKFEPVRPGEVCAVCEQSIEGREAFVSFTDRCGPRLIHVLCMTLGGLPEKRQGPFNPGPRAGVGGGS